MNAHAADDFEDMARRFDAGGFGVQRTSHFGTPGITVGVRPQRTSAEHITLMDPVVSLYVREGAWEARVTDHGGPHWIKRASTFEELEAIGVLVLTSERGPRTTPGIGWTTAW